MALFTFFLLFVILALVFFVTALTPRPQSRHKDSNFWFEAIVIAAILLWVWQGFGHTPIPLPTGPTAQHG